MASFALNRSSQWLGEHRWWLLPLCGISLLVALIDLGQRVIVSGEPVESELSDVAPKAVVWAPLDEQTQAKRWQPFKAQQQALEGSDSTTENVEDKLMSKEEQLSQQGNLNQLWVDDKTYRLMGVFTQDSSAFAVLLERDERNNTTKRRQVSKGQSLEQYLISGIGKQSVEIQAGERSIQLQIFAQQ